MNSKYIENIIYLSKCIYYSTDLTVYAFKNWDIIYTTNPSSLTAHKILFGEHQRLNILDRKTKYQILNNDYKENFYVISLYEHDLLVIIGPFLNEEINSGTITNMIRDNLVPFHSKTDIQEYYKTLPVFNEDKIFYTSKMIENIFDNLENPTKNNKNTKNDNTKLNDEYYKKVKENRMEAFSHSSYANEQKVSETIRIGDKENAKRILKEINLTPHAKLAVDTIRSYKNSMICSCTFMTRAAISGGVNPDVAFTLSDTYINNIEKIQNLNDLENYEAVMVEGFTDLVNNIKTNRYSRSILLAMNYIDAHLCDDIKIKDIAKNSYLNPSYLSNLFHKETNKTISDWILERRIKEAAFSISNTNESIADIAFFYNFCSQSYFIKCFKKVMGTTPNEYRNNTNKMKDRT